MPEYYPVFLNLETKKCLVCGLGKVGLRKLQALLRCNPGSVLVLDLRQEPPGLEKLLETYPQLYFECRSFEEKDLDGCFLAFGCTNDKNVNRKLAKACAKRNIPCNCITEPEAGDMIIPALASKGNLRLAVSSSGNSPLLVAHLRTEFEKWLEPHARFACFLGLFRKELLRVSTDSCLNREIFVALLDSPLEKWFARGEFENCRKWLYANTELEHGRIDRLLEMTNNDIS